MFVLGIVARSSALGSSLDLPLARVLQCHAALAGDGRGVRLAQHIFRNMAAMFSSARQPRWVPTSTPRSCFLWVGSQHKNSAAKNRTGGWLISFPQFCFCRKQPSGSCPLAKAHEVIEPAREYLRVALPACSGGQRKRASHRNMRRRTGGSRKLLPAVRMLTCKG